MQPKISVLMSVYNGARDLREAIDSILHQTFADFEFIIIDDASNDNSPSILAEYAAKDKRIRLITNEFNLGLTKNLNRAIKESRGTIDIVSDEEILDAQRWLASAEGIFVEPASAAPIAGLLRACDLKNAARFNSSAIPEGCRIVCTVTGHGLKDPSVIATASHAAVEPNESAVRRALEKRRG